jgi:hypothetical protein
MCEQDMVQLCEQDMVQLWATSHKVICLNAYEESALTHESFALVETYSAWIVQFMAFNCEGNFPNSFSWYFSDPSDNQHNSNPKNRESGFDF